MCRIILIGDVHGMLPELLALLGALEYSSNDRLIFTGDLVDRGPDSAGCVGLVRALKAECVLGNHEEKLVRYRNWNRKIVAGTAKKNPMQMSDAKLAVYQSLLDTDLDWMESLPTTLRIPQLHGKDWLVVHGGFEAISVAPEYQKKKIMIRLRYIGDSGTMVGRPDYIPPGAVPWMERWSRPECVVYGHVVHSLDTPRVDQNELGVHCIGLDTGACFGGHLTALVVYPDEPGRYEFVQEKASQAYADLYSVKE